MISDNNKGRNEERIHEERINEKNDTKIYDKAMNDVHDKK